MKAHKSALKHGISEDAGIYAAKHHVYVADLDDDNPARQFRLGFDPERTPPGAGCAALRQRKRATHSRYEGPTSVRRSPVIDLCSPKAMQGSRPARRYDEDIGINAR